MGVDGGSDALVDVGIDGTIEAFAVSGWGCGDGVDVVEGEVDVGGVFFGVGGPGEVHAAGSPCVASGLLGLVVVWVSGWCVFGGWLRFG